VVAAAADEVDSTTTGVDDEAGVDALKRIVNEEWDVG